MALPKPEEARLGHSTASNDDPRYIAVTRAQSRREDIPIPKANPKWLPQARSWFNSLALSGQSDLYEASDWATGVAAATAFDYFLRSGNASVFAQFVRLSERLAVTVTDRKRSRIELVDSDDADADEDAANDAVAGWQGQLRAVE
jgi:hypothetical protein